MLAIDLATDPLVRSFFQDLVKLGGVAKDVEDFLLQKKAANSNRNGIHAVHRNKSKPTLCAGSRKRCGEGRLPYFGTLAFASKRMRDWRKDDGNQIAFLNAV